MRAGLVTRLGRCELCPARDDPFGGALPDLGGPTLLDLAERILDERGRARQRL
jgi:hypothetical protein